MGGTNTSIALFSHIYKNIVVKLYVGEHVKETKTQCVRVQNQCKRIFSHERYEIGGGEEVEWERTPVYKFGIKKTKKKLMETTFKFNQDPAC